MKSKRLLLLLILSALCLSNLLADHEAKITFHLITDDGKTLTNFPYQASAWKTSFISTQDRAIQVSGKTDNKGLVTLELPYSYGRISHGIPYNSSGYYNQNSNLIPTNLLSGHWQPWNPTIDVVVKPILNPIAMYARNVRQTLGGPVIIPATNVPVGFDLEAGDWVAPYGKGTVADFVFTKKDKTPFIENTQPFDVIWTLSFSNNGDGIQSVLEPQNAGSALRLPRYAPETGYKSILVQELSYDGKKWEKGAIGEDQNYFFRVRSVLDEQGNVKSALYGKISGPVGCGGYGSVRFTYYLNPTPNDRNMEFDPSKNLFQNLPSLQQVKAP